ncbi:MAG: aminotransferase [Alphaproteobacteria bacterium RIFCSPHIGHO2_12_FULL_63_12]|nr:MAG: aminotransferase [Alphaproteobacteria bacterium RIFCSPHIGHO2_12_FULL_63_12]
MSALARQHGAVNLGQGFPDEDGPAELIEAAVRALTKGPNQYAPVQGVPELRQAIARTNKRFYGIDIDWESETLVTAGATEALAAAFLAFLRPGDEAVLIAPCYDSYAPIVESAGAVARYAHLTPPDWRLQRAALLSAITPRTRLIAMNTPHNPTGRVLTMDELKIIADVAIEHDLIVVCDEVYEHLVFDKRPHIPLMGLAGMRERCVRIGSAGKTFSMTGWRIGYVSGPESLITGVMKAHQFIAYTCPPHLQLAVAEGLAMADDYFERFVAGMARKRDRIVEGLKGVGMEVLPCEGTYFATIDIHSVGRDDDDAFCRELTQKAGVAAIPVSAFYSSGDKMAARRYARFCFCKKPEVLDEAMARLKAYFG